MADVVSYKIFKDQDTKIRYLDKILITGKIRRTQLSDNIHYKKFICSPRNHLEREPTDEKFERYGGYIENHSGKYYAISDTKVACSPSSVCKSLLTRKNSSKPRSEHEWRGPYHVYLHILGKWTMLADLDVQLSNSDNVPLLRSQLFYGKKVTYSIQAN